MQAAFASPVLLRSRLRCAENSRPIRRSHAPPVCATPPKRPRRIKRPRSPKPTSGFSTAAPPPDPIPLPPETEEPPAPSSGPDLQAIDADGISLEVRLREEIKHPLRKPKLTFFLTLALSATLGLFFALARARKDPAQRVAINVAVDVIAIALFAYLARREADFGRRAINSLAGLPQTRDLPLVMLGHERNASFGGLRRGASRMEDLLKRGDVVVAAGRAADLRRYMERVRADEEGLLVVVPTDARGEGEGAYEGAAAVASGEAEHAKDWVAWLGEAVPPKRNVALFRVVGDGTEKGGAGYVVAVGEPGVVPLPVDARREGEVVEV